jgi:hypothetical protein
MKHLKLYEDHIQEAAEEAASIDLTKSAAESSTAIKYNNPVEATIKKDSTKGKESAILIETPKGSKHIYNIVGGFGAGNINFKTIKRESNGDLKLARYISGGVKWETIPYDKIKDLLPKLAGGYKEYSPVTGITFYKIG